VLGALGLVGLLGAGGIVGARFAAAEEAEHEALAALPPTSCMPPEQDCAPTTGVCGGSCAICPRTQTQA
jgi:hypothetical protein